MHLLAVKDKAKDFKRSGIIVGYAKNVKNGILLSFASWIILPDGSRKEIPEGSTMEFGPRDRMLLVPIKPEKKKKSDFVVIVWPKEDVTLNPNWEELHGPGQN